MARWSSIAGLAAVLAVLALLACESGRERAPAAIETGDRAAPPVTAPAGVEVPEGMVYVPGGRTLIGSETGEPHERPVFEAHVPEFFLDAHPVTVAQYRAFVDDRRYETDGERFGSGAVFDFTTGRWRLVDGANWRYPLGPGHPPAADDHPVTHVSWHDAVAYAAWAGRRLPSEVEWEHAARGGVNSRDRYSWGNELIVSGRPRANTWHGHSSSDDPGRDGYLLTSPAGTFGRTPLALTDMGGNVWEWVSDWYRPYSERHSPYTPTETSEKVQRGGSFLCHASYCHGYRVSARGHSTTESSHFHVGFRTAMDVSRRTQN